MFSSTPIFLIFSIIISIIIIRIIHHGWEYIKNSFSKRKTKDLVNTQIEKYKKMLDEIHDSRTSTEFLNENDKNSMNNDLTDFAASLYS
jgi:predicted PurR-regulated permease PerM